MIDGMKQFRIGLDLPPCQHLDRAGHADPRLVVAIDIGAHVQFELVLLRVQELADLLGIADRVRARAIVPDIGQVSTRLPSERTNISGEADTRNSPSPRFISAP